MDEITKAFTNTFDSVYPTTAVASGEAKDVICAAIKKTRTQSAISTPRVFIPVFPGTNCEYDTACIANISTINSLIHFVIKPVQFFKIWDKLLIHWQFNQINFVSVAKPPTGGKTDTTTVSSFACSPYLMENSPFTGAIYSIVASISKLIASGVKKSTIRLTLQEFFKKLGKDANRWGEPTSALLGAL